MSLLVNKEEEEEGGGREGGGENHLLWPLVLHLRGNYCILVLPLVELRHLKAYARICRRADCGNAVGLDASLSSLLLDLPSITGYGKLLSVFSMENSTRDYVSLEHFALTTE